MPFIGLVNIRQNDEISSAIARRIYFVRKHRVMVDQDLAGLYGVETKSLNLAVRRNLKRFPYDFMFQVTEEEYELLRFQFETSKRTAEKRGGRRYLPYVFTEQGVAMLSSVLRSDQAIEANIAIMRTFVGIRGMLETNKALAEKVRQLEGKYDEQFRLVFDAIRRLLATDKLDGKRRRIGFRWD